MNLYDTLFEIAAFLGLDATTLVEFATDDRIGGFHDDPSKRSFPGGSLWEVEGKTLYALVRALRPQHALELGVLHGASSTHILAAQARNGYGALYSVDWWEGAGTLVPVTLRDWWTLTHMEAVDYINHKVRRGEIGFVYEDCIHSESEVYAIVTALKPKLRKGAVVVHHDSEHGDDGQQIRRALERAGVNFKSWLIEPSDCGLAIWRAE